MAHAEHAEDSYYVPHGSYWPFLLTVGLALLLGGFSLYLNNSSIGPAMAFIGGVVTIAIVFLWFRTVVQESNAGVYSDQVDRTFRWGMFWFIFSEVMFFAAFFGALYYARNFSGPWLGGETGNIATHLLLWPNFEFSWPSNGPENWGGDFKKMGAWGLPAINTALLLTSGITLTYAHWGIEKMKRTQVIIGLALTVALGVIFLYYQVQEYVEAYAHFNLKLSTGIYGSTFFLLTGFHGLHVFLGALMLFIVLLRVMKGHFTKEKHFAFEAAAWYWHFVDVVWLGLFIFVYII